MTDSNREDKESKTSSEVGAKESETSEKKYDVKKSSPFQPVNFLRWAVTNSTRLIGWNDDDFRVLLEDHRRRRAEDSSLPDIEKEGFGLMSTIQELAKDGLRDFIDKKSESDDLKEMLRQIDDNNSKKQKDVKVETDTSLSSWYDMNIFNYINMRDFKWYQNILSNIKFQRDTYIMGTDHAIMRKEKREQEEILRKEEQAAREADPFLTDMDDDDADTEIDSIFFKAPITYRDYLELHPTVDDSSSLGNQQLNGILSWFIPSPTVYDSLLPNVLYTISPPSPLQPQGGPLRRRINRSVCDLIPMSQNLLNDAVQSNVMWVLTDSSWRESVKGSSRNYFTANQNSGHNPNSRVVTTKTMRSFA